MGSETESVEAKPRFLLTVRKWDVVDTLRRQHSLQTMVQILTPSTGPDMHGRPEVARFPSVTTLTYAAPQHRREFEDAKSLPTLDELETWCRANPLRADIVFIDAWHAYDDSVRVLDLALSFLTQGGWIVMHDCDPPDLDAAGPPKELVTMLWCGDTWRAFVDVTSALPAGCEWFVVESDLGIGVVHVQPPRRSVLGNHRRATPRRKQAPEGDEAGWNWLVEHRDRVLHPMSIAAWQQLANGGDGSAQ